MADCVHGLQHVRMAPDLDLWPGPEEAKVLGVMSGEPRDLGVPPGVAPELGLPRRGLFFRNDAADDDAAGLLHDVCELLGETSVMGLQIREADLRNRTGPLLGNTVGFLF